MKIKNKPSNKSSKKRSHLHENFRKPFGRESRVLLNEISFKGAFKSLKSRFSTKKEEQPAEPEREYNHEYFKNKFLDHWKKYIRLTKANPEEPPVEKVLTFIGDVYGVPEKLIPFIKVHDGIMKKDLISLYKEDENRLLTKDQFDQVVERVADIETEYVLAGGKAEQTKVKIHDQQNKSSQEKSKDDQEELIKKSLKALQTRLGSDDMKELYNLLKSNPQVIQKALEKTI